MTVENRTEQHHCKRWQMRYKTLQHQLQFVSDQCFAVEDTADMTARYLELLAANPVKMLPLKYGTLQVEERNKRR